MTFLAEADVLLLVARPTLAQAEGVATRLEALRSIGPHLGVLLVGDRPYSATEFSAAVGADIAGVVDFDRRGAEAIVQAPGSLLSRRSLLTRSVSGVADGIRDRYFTNVGADW